jgi:hypothetical protein
MRLLNRSLIAQQYSFPSAVGCSVMSVTHTWSGAGAVKSRCTRSSCTAGPGLLPLRRRPLRTVADHSFCCEHKRQIRRSPTTSPSRSTSSARKR